MGWVWKDDDAPHGSSSGEPTKFVGSSSDSDDRCSTRKVIKSQCRTEEIEPGKFMRKCEKTEEIFKDCLGRPTELVQSNKEYTEEDVTGQVAKGSFAFENTDNFNFQGLQSDIEAIGRSFFGDLGGFFEAAEEMKNGFFNVFGTPGTPRTYDSDSSSATKRRGISIEGYPPPPKEVPPTLSKSDGDIDLSGLAKDI